MRISSVICKWLLRPWPCHCGGAAQGHTRSVLPVEPSHPPPLSLVPVSLRQRSTRMRGGQFGFDDPAEKEIQTLFRNACPPGRGPSNQDRETWIVSVIQGLGASWCQRPGRLGSDPRFGRASSPPT